MSDTRDKVNQLSSKDFSFLCEYVYEASGIVLGESKKEMVYRRLTRIIRERKLPSFSAYCDVLRESPEKEKNYFINAITTNLTSFFREQHHFDYLSEHELPKLLKNPLQKKRIRIWSSASSTGEEPYSIAMTLNEALNGNHAGWDAKILATDIDSNVLQFGKNGIYERKRIEDIPEKLKKKYFQQGAGENSNKVKVDEKLKTLLTFKQLNLLHEWPMTGKFDVIFCRNVIIYFDKETQLGLFERYYDMLKPNGLLLLGHSENLGNFQKYFENVGRTIFRRKG